MKKTVLSLSIICFSLISYGQNIDTKKYKFEMTIPTGFEFQLTEPNGYAKIKGYNQTTDTNIHAYAFFHEDFTRENLVNFGASESGINAESWEKVADGTGENGFAWWDTYEASAGDKVFYGVIAKNEFNDIHYLFFAMATPESFEENQDQYIEWAMSCQGLK